MNSKIDMNAEYIPYLKDLIIFLENNTLPYAKSMKTELLDFTYDIKKKLLSVSRKEVARRIEEFALIDTSHNLIRSDYFTDHDWIKYCRDYKLKQLHTTI